MGGVAKRRCFSASERRYKLRPESGRSSHDKIDRITRKRGEYNLMNPPHTHTPIYTYI